MRVLLDLDHPLTADANAFGKTQLIKFQPLASVANDGCEIGGGADSMASLHVSVRLHHTSPNGDN